MPSYPPLSSYLKKPENAGNFDTQTSTPALLAKPIIPQIVDFAKKVPATVKSAALSIKEFVLPPRGFTDQQIATAQPTTGERFKGVARAGAEIVGGLTSIGQSVLSSLPIPQPKLDNTLLTKIQDFAKPKTAGEAKVMRFADIAGFLPIGQAKNVGKVVDLIAKSKNADEIASLLAKTGVAKDSISTMSKVLVGVDNPKKVNTIIEGFDISSKILKPKVIPEINPARLKLEEEIGNLKMMKEVSSDVVSILPGKQLVKYAYKGILPEAGISKTLGKNGVSLKKQGKFNRLGDDILENDIGYKNGTNEAQDLLDSYIKQKEELGDTISRLKEKKLELKAFDKVNSPKPPLKKSRVGILPKAKAENVTAKVPQKISQEGIPLALSKKEKEIVANRGDSTLSRQSEISRGEAKSIEIQAEQARSIAKGGDVPVGVSLPKIIAGMVTPVKNRVNIIDTFLRTPNRVMAKIGLGNEAKELRVAMDGYWKELPQNIKKIEQWQKDVSKESNVRIFKFLDGQAIDLRPEEQKVADEIKTWLSEWASRLKLGADNRISDYITHIFDKEFSQKGFDEELAKIITDKIPGSVYNPFTLKRLGAKGYIEDTWKALDAYVKRGTRKVYIDPVLEKLQSKVGSSLEVSNIEKSQYQYVQKYISNINMRPTDLDESIDNVVRSFTGRFGERPVTTLTKTLRQMTFRGMLGLNPGSALRNLSQGINTYATLGEKYTAIGYVSIFKKGALQEMEREGVLSAGFIQDKVLSATRKKIQQADKVLFAFFDTAERVNRGSAYFGAKAKGISLGYSEEKAIEYAKTIVRKTQFVFDSVDTPVGMGSDIAKTLFQFQTYTTKQIEFLTEMAKDKNAIGLLRYAVAGTAFVYTIGKAFGMEPKELIPWYRFDFPPSMKFPVEAVKAIVNAPGKYGEQRDLSKKLKDVGNSALGLIPAGIQSKKTIQGIQAVRQGKSTDAAGRAQFDVGGTKAKDIQAFLFGKYAGDNAKAYFDGKKYAEARYEKLLQSPTRKEDWIKIVKEDPNLAKAIARVKEKIDLNITEEDDKILALGVENKARAQFVASKIKTLKTKEEKKALIVEYIKKKIITDQVSEQLVDILK